MLVVLQVLWFCRFRLGSPPSVSCSTSCCRTFIEQRTPIPTIGFAYRFGMRMGETRVLENPEFPIETQFLEWIGQKNPFFLFLTNRNSGCCSLKTHTRTQKKRRLLRPLATVLAARPARDPGCLGHCRRPQATKSLRDSVAITGCSPSVLPALNLADNPYIRKKNRAIDSPLWGP